MKLMKFLFSYLLIFFYIPGYAQIKYPKTQKVQHTDTYFDTVIEDPYVWLENDTSLITAQWVKAQNEVTFSYLEQIPYRNAIARRLQELLQFPRVLTVKKAGKYIIYSRNDGLQNQAVWYIREGMEGEEKVLIDPNQLDASGTTSIDIAGISQNNQYVAINISKAGSDWRTMRIIRLDNQQMLEDQLEWVKFTDAAWFMNGFFYSRYPQPEKGTEFSAATQYQSIWYHALGSSQKEDVMIYIDSLHPKHYHSLEVTHDNRYLILYKSTGTDGYETYYMDINEQDTATTYHFKPLFTGFKHKNQVIYHSNGKLIIHTDIDAPNYRLIAVDPLKPEKENWVELIPEQKSVLAEVQATDGFILTKYMENASNQLKLFHWDGSFYRDISTPGLGTINITHASPKDSLVFFTFSSFTQPGSVWSFNLNQLTNSPFFQPQLTFHPEDFVTEQVRYPSTDGTIITMFLTYKKGLHKNGMNPTYLYGYGGFNISILPTFSSNLIALLEQGFIVAIPNLRGGGEYGENWHRAGMLMNKQNVFNDFIAAAEYLIRENYTSSEKLAIAGRSNGGLLVGACMTQKPNLFKVALPGVGVLDMLKFQDFTVGWGWVPEYGSSRQSKEMFRYLLSYSPYHQLKKGTSYPATLVTTADHDDRVVPAHSFKFTARLQEYHQGENPVLIRIDTQARHGAGKPISKVIEEAADMWAFTMWNLGIRHFQVNKVWDPERGHLPQLEKQ
jgi:prolyl oligopeptidase